MRDGHPLDPLTGAPLTREGWLEDGYGRSVADDELLALAIEMGGEAVEYYEINAVAGYTLAELGLTVAPVKATPASVVAAYAAGRRAKA